ncbi:hypothetical protein JVT61DRAFT_3941 [Boletus reticuloceps]|uniref:Uncharacterized protein n=1 Tax=Boletus reticuloceps TaxID=495285 RepID=A0A8I3A974_9AGAM|nr:hypothetical protein JVT61DRAFT_3941 [Boletus reticuloceps]
MNNVYYIAGSFLSIANISTTYVASYSPSSGAFSALGSGGPVGPVNALFCDSNNDNLWVEGRLSSPGSSVAVWNPKLNSWSAPVSMDQRRGGCDPSSADPQYSGIQAILCPAGPDGPGSTWLTASRNAALITVRTFTAMSAYGIRIGNMFLSGYGTMAFRYLSALRSNLMRSLTLFYQCHINSGQYSPKSYIFGSMGQ